jgi:hypothetical protein
MALKITWNILQESHECVSISEKANSLRKTLKLDAWNMCNEFIVWTMYYMFFDIT